MTKLLLDECVPQGLRSSLTGFDTYTVTYMGWSGLKNGKLLQSAVDSGFEIFLTIHKNLQYRQNMHKYPIIIVVFDVVRLELENILVLLPKFNQLVGHFEKHHVYLID